MMHRKNKTNCDAKGVVAMVKYILKMMFLTIVFFIALTQKVR